MSALRRTGTFPSIFVACEQLEHWAEEIRADGLDLGQLAALVDIENPAAVDVHLLPRSEILSFPATRQHPEARRALEAAETRVLRVIVDAGDDAGTTLLEQFSEAVRAAAFVEAHHGG